MTPKQMKYLVLFGLMVVVLFLATFMSMGVTEGFLTSKERRNNCKPPKFWDTKNNDCVDDCPVGTKKKENDGGFGCFKIKVTHPKCKETVDTPYWYGKDKKCVAGCTGNYILDEKTFQCLPKTHEKCKKSVDTPYWNPIDSVCVTGCTGDYILDEKSFACLRKRETHEKCKETVDKPFWNPIDRVCVTDCPDGYTRNGNGFMCIPKCKDDTPFWNPKDKKCVSECPSDYPANHNGVCRSLKPAPVTSSVSSASGQENVSGQAVSTASGQENVSGKAVSSIQFQPSPTQPVPTVPYKLATLE